MAGSDHSKAALSSRAGKLSKLFNLNEKNPDEWGERALPAMARHQFAAPLGFDLMGLVLKPADGQARALGLSQAKANGTASFEDLLFHPEPPLELLRLAKDFFKKRTREHHKGSAEWQVAYLFYVLSIVAAGARAEEVSALAPADLLKAVVWASEQSWVDERTKRLLSAAASRLERLEFEEAMAKAAIQKPER